MVEGDIPAAPCCVWHPFKLTGFWAGVHYPPTTPNTHPASMREGGRFVCGETLSQLGGSPKQKGAQQEGSPKRSFLYECVFRVKLQGEQVPPLLLCWVRFSRRKPSNSYSMCYTLRVTGGKSWLRDGTTCIWGSIPLSFNWEIVSPTFAP